MTSGVNITVPQSAGWFTISHRAAERFGQAESDRARLMWIKVEKAWTAVEIWIGGEAGITARFRWSAAEPLRRRRWYPIRFCNTMSLPSSRSSDERHRPANPRARSRRLGHGRPHARLDRARRSDWADRRPSSGAIDFAGRNDCDRPDRQPCLDGSSGVGPAVLDQRYHEHRARRG